MQCVNIENWTYCRYEKGNFKAFITFGSSPEAIATDRLEYFVTVLENDEKEIYQETFDSLSDACFTLNEKYSDWTFTDQLAPKSGCSTCAAH